MKIFNTYTRQKEEFVPIEAGKVRMYVCGPTVYNYIHIGNARSAIAFDVVRRYLEYRGYDVNYVSNFTDVDDKIIRRANELHKTAKEIADTYIEAFSEDTRALNIKKATENPRVMDMMPEIIDFISALIEKDWAYESYGDVYFRARNFPDYGKLANKTIDDLRAGESGRTGAEADLKEDPIDFALWKQAKPGEPSWESPWGEGRPGWHIECSVMATNILGDTIDIHGGGSDLEFPHHTNEIAQSEAKTGHKFVNYWMHNGFVNIDGDKMSKSLGNFITVHDLLEKVSGELIRFMMSTTHYRRPIDFTQCLMDEAQINLDKIKTAWNNFTFRKKDLVASLPNDADVLAKIAEIENRFITEMDDDFNAANGIACVYELVTLMNVYSEEAQVSAVVYEKAVTLLSQWMEIFGVELAQNDHSLNDEVEALIAERNEARKNKNFARSDEIRDDLKARGIILEDTANGTRWHIEE
jgi:cysteinyl-tRNA synthetase